MYGRDRAAMVSEVISYRGRSALREVGKVFGLSLDQARPALRARHAHGSRRRSPRRASPRPASIPRTSGSARSCAGPASSRASPATCPSTWAASCSRPSRSPRVAPIEPARMPGRTVIPWDKDDLDDLGFFKIDVLGAGDAHRHPQGARRSSTRRGRRRPLRLRSRRSPASRRRIPAVYARHPARRRGRRLPDREPRADVDAARASAPRASTIWWSRWPSSGPGPIQGGMVHPYLRRRTGRERPEPPHPCLAPILDADAGRAALPGAGDADRHGRRRLHARRGRPAPPRHGGLAQDREARAPPREAARRASPAAASPARSASSSTSRSTASASTASPSRTPRASRSSCTPRRGSRCTTRPSSPARCSTRSRWASTARRRSSRTRSATASRRARPAWRGARGTRRWSRGEAIAAALRLGLPADPRHGRGRGPTPSPTRADGGALRVARDLVRRARLKKNDAEALAEAGALAPMVPARREALFRARAPREGGLFEGLDIEADEDVGLPPLPPARRSSRSTTGGWACRSTITRSRTCARASPPAGCAARRSSRALRHGIAW